MSAYGEVIAWRAFEQCFSQLLYADFFALAPLLGGEPPAAAIVSREKSLVKKRRIGKSTAAVIRKIDAVVFVRAVVKHNNALNSDRPHASAKLRGKRRKAVNRLVNSEKVLLGIGGFYRKLGALRLAVFDDNVVVLINAVGKMNYKRRYRHTHNKKDENEPVSANKLPQIFQRIHFITLRTKLFEKHTSEHRYFVRTNKRLGILHISEAKNLFSITKRHSDECL